MKHIKDYKLIKNSNRLLNIIIKLNDKTKNFKFNSNILLIYSNLNKKQLNLILNILIDLKIIIKTNYKLYKLNPYYNLFTKKRECYNVDY